MAIKKKRVSMPTTRELKKLKAKFDEKPNERTLMRQYLKMLKVMGKKDELNAELKRLLVINKGKTFFSELSFTITKSSFDILEEELKEGLVDNFLVVKKTGLDTLFNNAHFDPEFKKLIHDRADFNGISLTSGTKESVADSKINKEDGSEDAPANEVIIALCNNKSHEVVNTAYDQFKEFKDSEWLTDKPLIKAIFKVAKNMRVIDYDKAQELLDFCLKVYPDNGNFQRVNNLWNPIVLEEGIAEEVSIEIIKDNKIQRIVPLDKQVYSEEELFELSPKLKTFIDDGIVQTCIEEENTKFRKSRSLGSILISLASSLVTNQEHVETADLIYSLIEEIRDNTGLRFREFKKANVLKYDILVALGKYEEAEEWNDNEELGMEPEVTTSDVVELTEAVAIRDDAQDIFHKTARNEAVRFYRKSVDSYINNGQFKHKLGEEVSEVVIENIKDKIAIDLQYLDFEIRELLLPYFIKVEANAKIVLKQYRNVIGNLIDKAFNDYTDELRFVIDVSKIKETGFKDEELFQRFLLSFRALRNHMVHGSPNMFALKIYEDKRVVQKNEMDYDDAISFFEESGNTNIDEILTNAKRKISGVDIFKLPIVERVLSYDATENKRGFGLALIILFMTTPRYTFLRIASEIDHKINIFKNRTVLGSKNKLYESLGINPNWIKELSNIEE